ncbi:MAG: tRNA-intron lyase [Candidatus Micrarchaeota archaeon]|nr:tRNA-intron lyase [Candidatus Micrarchaeota archaeon]
MTIKFFADVNSKKIYTSDPSSVSTLENSFFGKREGQTLFLSPIEALYLIDVRKAICVETNTNKEVDFNFLASKFLENSLSKYFAYCAWRERGLIARDLNFQELKNYNRNPVINYEGKKLETYKIKSKAFFYKDSLIAVLQNSKELRDLYLKYWFGQYGLYKADQKGSVMKLDIFETIFLARHFGLKIENYSLEQIFKIAKSHISDFEKFYQIYEDWRLNGFILKTGFKFGTHFRVYFPTQANYEHSKHVLEVFSKERSQIIYRWARAIRVAHSVKKTFIFAIEGQKKEIKKLLRPKYTHFVLYSRKNGTIAKPTTDKPSYLMLCLSEFDYISGKILAGAIEECKAFGLGLVLAIADRESSTTFYLVNRINIPQSNYEYYQLEWFLP